MKAVMTFNEAFRATEILKFIDIRDGEKELAPKVAAEVMLVKGAYKKALESFQGIMQEVSQGLKKEGYDKREADAAWYKEYQEKVEAKEKISPEDKKRAATIKATLSLFEKERADYNAALQEAYEKTGKDEVEVAHAYLSQEAYAAICETFGLAGKAKFKFYINGEESVNEVARAPLMFDVATYLVG